MADAQREVTQARAASLLAQGYTYAEAAEQLQLTRDALVHHMRNPEGRVAIRAAAEAAKAAALAAASATLEVASVRAVSTLVECLDAGRDADRIAAARAILDRVGLFPKRTLQHSHAEEAEQLSGDELEREGAEALAWLAAERADRERVAAQLNQEDWTTGDPSGPHETPDAGDLDGLGAGDLEAHGRELDRGQATTEGGGGLAETPPSARGAPPLEPPTHPSQKS